MSETTIVNSIRLTHGIGDTRLFRNNNGGLYDKDGRLITYGLGTGTSDIIGWRSVIITPEMVGRRVAIFTGLEVKTPEWKPRGSADQQRLKNQLNFIQLLNDHGGCGALVHSVYEAELALRNTMR